MNTNEPLVIAQQGSFFAGGTTIKNEGTYSSSNPNSHSGQTLYGDHAYVSFQIPENPHRLPLVFLHGAGQSGKTWESTPDGREGFGSIFLRRGFATYILDQPRRGRAGNSTVSEQITVLPNDQFWFENFRMGMYPNLFPNSQFPNDPESLNQFLRQITPNTGAYDLEAIASATAAVFDRIGEGILITHSQGGGPGWQTALKTDKVKAVISYEPGTEFVFPEGEMPTVPTPANDVAHISLSQPISLEQFKALTRIPIVIYYGDNIRTGTEHFAFNRWYERMQVAKAFAACINKHGGDASVVLLPEKGITGNSHFMFAEKNNLQVADLLSSWLAEKNLDK
ncbi:alpha/beta hydrolase [Capnocytophaga sp. HP1101]